MSGGLRRVDPATDAEEVELPELMEVGISETGVRFHLLDDGRPVCDRREMIDEVDSIVVRDAREKGYTSCRSCFRPVDERELPDRVVVAVGGDAEAYHRQREGVEEHRPACNYGSVPHSEMAFVDVDREQAEQANLDPCEGCFGAAAPQMQDACPLCGEPDVSILARHLRVECPAAKVEVNR